MLTFPQIVKMLPIKRLNVSLKVDCVYKPMKFLRLRVNLLKLTCISLILIIPSMFQVIRSQRDETGNFNLYLFVWSAYFVHFEPVFNQ